MEKAIDHKNFFYPPGGILLWIIIVIELGTFGMALVGLGLFAREDPGLFHESRLLLNPAFGAINTVFLLSSGYFMALAVSTFKKGLLAKAGRYIGLAIMGGGLFVILKVVEYAQKLEAGLDLGSNMFFSFYWLLTGFHLVHVLVGMAILGWFSVALKRKKNEIKLEDLEAGGAFWHMCDLIWLLLFPTLYLIL